MADVQMNVGPVPTQIGVGHNGEHVTLQVSTPVGVNVYFFDADAARSIAGFLEKSASMLSSGLIVAGADDLPPSPNGQRP